MEDPEPSVPGLPRDSDTYSVGSYSEEDEWNSPVSLSQADQTENPLQTQKGPEDTVLIAVFGATGTGKSTFIKNISGQDVVVGHNLQSCTQTIEEIQCVIDGQKLTIVDTPGFDDSERSDTQILQLIADWLERAYAERTLLSGIIYLHRISDIRMSGSSIKNLRMFRKLCGAENMKSVRLVTTMWDSVTPEDGERRENDLIADDGFWASEIASGCVVDRHDGTYDSAKRVISSLVPKPPVVIQLQKELVSGKALIETDAGSDLNAEIIKIKKRHEEDLAAFREETELAIKAGNEALQKRLESQHAETLLKLALKQQEQVKLMEARTTKFEKQLQEVTSKHEMERKELQDKILALEADLNPPSPPDARLCPTRRSVMHHRLCGHEWVRYEHSCLDRVNCPRCGIMMPTKVYSSCPNRGYHRGVLMRAGPIVQGY